MAERTTTTCENSWPSKREAFTLGYTLGHLQATVDAQKMQNSPPRSGDSWTQRGLRRAKAWAEGYELVSKLWAWQRRLAWPSLIVSWSWEHVIWLLRLLLG
jgi:hypothetical protein